MVQTRSASETNLLLLLTKEKELREAAQVIRAKHDTMPACFLQCKGLNTQDFK